MTNQLSPERAIRDFCNEHYDESGEYFEDFVTVLTQFVTDQREQAVKELFDEGILTVQIDPDTKEVKPLYPFLKQLIALRIDNERMRKALEKQRCRCTNGGRTYEYGDFYPPEECARCDALSTRTETPVAEEVIRLAIIALSLNQHDDYNGYGIYRRARSEASKTSPVTRQALESWRAG